MTRRAVARGAFILISVAAGAWASSSGAVGIARLGAAMAPGQRVVLVGLDAADWLTIDPMIAAGELPTFGRLKAAGRTAVMISTPPLVSPILWTTIATGLAPDKHGVLDFMVDLPDGGQTPVRSIDRRAPALWNVFSANDRRVGVVGWWATWPAEHVSGTIVSDAVAPQLLKANPQIDADAVWPEAARQSVASRLVTPDRVTLAELAKYIPVTQEEFDQARTAIRSPARLYENSVAHLAAIVASTRTYTAASLDLLGRDRPDFLAVYLEEIDSVSHLFVRDRRRGPRAIARAYRDADELILKLAAASPPETIFVVCSDHGFYPATAAVAEDPANLLGAATAWHRPYGIAAISTAGVLAGRSPSAPPREASRVTLTPQDVAPTVLHTAGLAITTDMAGRVVTELLPDAAAARPVRRTAPPPMAPRTPVVSDVRQAASEKARLQSLGYISNAGSASSLARQNLGEVLYRRGDFQGAERELRRVIQTQPGNLAATLWLAKALAQQKKSAEALTAYEAAMALPGGAREGLVEGVALALSSRNTDGAQRLVGIAGPASDARSELAVARGDIDRAANHNRQAEDSYRDALRMDPLSFDAAARLLELLVQLRRPGEAVIALEPALKRAPDSPRHLALMGEARLAAGDAAGAERDLNRALQLVPDGSLVRLSLARARLMQGNSRDAIHTLEGAPPSGERQALLGAAFSARREWSDAVAALDDATRRDMATPEVLNQLGWALIQVGQRDRAADVLRQSLSQKPDQPEIRKLLATLTDPRKNVAP